jgi:hypothetical protein
MNGCLLTAILILALVTTAYGIHINWHVIQIKS